MGEYKNITCRGCWQLGNNCKTCEKCIETNPLVQLSAAKIGAGPGVGLKSVWNEIPQSLLQYQGWQCPGCKTYYSPNQTACHCAKGYVS